MPAPVSNVRPPPDALLAEIADYALNYDSPSAEALDTARWCLLDTLACGIMALKYPACTKLLGPVVPGTSIVNGARVPGTSHELDPVQAAFNIGTIVRWLDFNDTWLAAEWGHPSDNLGAILAARLDVPYAPTIFARNAEVLRRFGIEARSFAYPYGIFSHSAKLQLAGLFDTCRCVRPGFASGTSRPSLQPGTLRR